MTEKPSPPGLQAGAASADYVPTVDRIEIVAAIDGGWASRACLAWVADHVANHPTEVQLVTVLGEMSDPDETLRSLEILSESMSRLCAANTAVHAHVKVREGDPVAMLLACEGDFFVIGSNRIADEPDDRESVSTRLASDSDRPVISVPTWWRAHGTGEIVVGVAPDLANDSALEFAARLAGRRDCRVRLIHVSEDIEAPDARLLLEQAEIAVRRAGADTVGIETRLGRPADELRRAVGKDDLLVIGRPRRTRLSRRLLGSTGRTLLRTLPCPVAIVPGRERHAQG